ncbi:hypothetical protein MPNT_10268 [Candidatus Methylacidithermus pantelleriae]|uniref:Uncharacterized protein n=1 Tax=Candidatus Methylacidithermus pantelleriae TaxID=2744239 RepID=A0A8J2BJH9_9BACT|nr:hypothetical protein MPNT_10268 [Candidatus Methylacidithermus pantelleriae]
MSLLKTQSLTPPGRARKNDRLFALPLQKIQAPLLISSPRPPKDVAHLGPILCCLAK